MVKVTRLDGSEFYVNAEFILSVESTPDTHIVMVSGPSYVVTERDDEVIDRILEYRRAAYGAAGAYGRLKAVEG